MTSLPILDLVAGMIFIYLLLSIINNSLFELAVTATKLRGSMLKDWLEETISVSTAQKLMNHPLLNGSSTKNKSSSYMNSKSFSSALIETILTSVPDAEKLGASKEKANIMDTIKTGIDQSGLPPELKRVLHLFVEKTKNSKLTDNKIEEIAHLENQIAQWFDNIMERLTGKFKRKSLWFTLIFGTILTISLNIDSISLMNYLYSNPEARQKLAAASYSAAKDSAYIKTIEKKAKETTDSAVKANLKQVITDIQSEKKTISNAASTMETLIPMGWKNTEDIKWTFGNVLAKIGGLLITILALCLGAPFWFSVLGKIADLRGTLKPAPAKQDKSE